MPLDIFGEKWSLLILRGALAHFCQARLQPYVALLLTWFDAYFGELRQYEVRRTLFLRTSL
jgi:hypothetical protein